MSRLIVAAILAVLGSSSVNHVHAVQVRLASGTLTIRGENFEEDIYVYERMGQATYGGGRYTYRATYIYVWIKDSKGKWLAYESFLKSDIDRIKIEARGGDDFVEVTTDIDSDIYGGDGDDILHGGDGDDYLDGGNAKIQDQIFGHGGSDVLYSGDKPHMYVSMSAWSYMDGGLGRDTYLFRNSDIVVLNYLGAWPGWLITPDEYTGGNDPLKVVIE